MVPYTINWLHLEPCSHDKPNRPVVWLDVKYNERLKYDCGEYIVSFSYTFCLTHVVFQSEPRTNDIIKGDMCSDILTIA